MPIDLNATAQSPTEVLQMSQGALAALAIQALVHSHRIDVSHEKITQAQLEEVFSKNGLRYTREYHLSARDIPDFFLNESGLVVEVKLKGAQKMAVYRQLERYARHGGVFGVMLVTNLAMGLPPEINGKPTFYVSLGRAWM